MALNSEQIVWLARIVRETQAVISVALSARSLTGSALTLADELIVTDIELWQEVENSFIRYKGDGVDFDNERKRIAIYYRLREALGLPFVAYEYDADLLQLLELEVGHSFG